MFANIKVCLMQKLNTSLRSDMIAGAMVAFVALPLSLAVGSASGVPPVAGLITAIVAGLVMSRFNSTSHAIGGPAAGLAPAILMGVTGLGQGNHELGYPLLLSVVILTGIAQVLLSHFKQVERLATLIPENVIRGLLVSIGILVMIKQMPTLLGYTSDANNTIAKILEIFSKLPESSLPIASLGLGVLLLVWIFCQLKRHIKVLNLFPPFFYALLLSSLVPLFTPLDFGPLLTLPASPYQAIVFPDFYRLFANPAVWSVGIQAFVAIFVIGTVETCASIKAIDQLSLNTQASPIAPTLKGVGLSGILAGLLGGVAVIPEVMRSTVGVTAGSQSKEVNFWYALFMLLGWLLLYPWLSQLPLTILAAVLIVCAYGLARPQFWKESWASGLFGFSVFSTTILLTLAYDLMLGLIAGSLLHFLFAKMKKYSRLQSFL